MRTILIWAATLALPLGAVAQPVSNSEKSAEVSDLVAQAREATAVSDVVVEACRLPADSEGYPTRSSRPIANREFDAPPRPIKRTEESSGTREFILRSIADFSKGSADFEHMDDALAKVTRTNLSLEKLWIACRGAFKEIKFLHVSQDGFDDFEVDFSRAAIEWEVDPLDAHQVTKQWAARFYYPEPMTRAFERLLISMERGRPDYRLLSSELEPRLQAEWSSLQQTFNKWRGPHSIVFLRKEDDGSYVYKSTYGYHVAFWTVGSLDAAGKITSLMCEEGA